MKKTFKMENLDCANCASKMETGISKLDGVNSANISFMTMKFTLDADDDKFESILDEAQKICTKVEKGCTIVR